MASHNVWIAVALAVLTAGLALGGKSTFYDEAAAEAVHTTEAPIPTVPPLPFLSFSTWAVTTMNKINAKGNATTLWSVGQHVNVDWVNKIRCRYEAQQLLPYVSNYSGMFVANYTSKVEETRFFSIITGDASNCSTVSLGDEALQPGGGWYLAPAPQLLSRMTFIAYVSTNNLNCTAFQYVYNTADGNQRILTWTVSTVGGIPQVYTNVTKNLATGDQLVLTTAFQGYHEISYLNEQCYMPFQCGPSVCVAIPTADPTAMLNGLQWACANGGIDCTNISAGGANYFPNTLIAHASFAFNEYYQANLVYAASSCNFGGTAEVAICNQNCTLCNAKTSATDAELGAALNWVCGPDGIQDCTAIQPGGQNFFPNTTHAHASWAFNVYYQAYKCIPFWKACDFNGTAQVDNC